MADKDHLFLSLLKPEQGRLLRLARSILRDEADAWDMVQDATLTAYDRFHELRGGAEAFGPWIRRILVNCCRNLLRKQSRTLVMELVGLELDADPGPGPEELLDQSLLWEEVMALDDHHRQVLVLRFLVDMTVEEVAAVLDVPSGTVKSRIHRALHALRKRLQSPGKGAVSHA